MRVEIVHGNCRYEGERYVSGDKLDITERYFAANPGRFRVVLNAAAEAEAQAAAEAEAQAAAEAEAQAAAEADPES